MSNTLNITAVDNELVIIAYQWGVSYQICDIKSGNQNSVNVSINIDQGSYTNSVVLDGVNGSLTGNYNVNLPPGAYSIIAIGLNWGAVQGFSFTFNNTTYASGTTALGVGLVWYSLPIPLTIGDFFPQPTVAPILQSWSQYVGNPEWGAYWVTGNSVMYAVGNLYPPTLPGQNNETSELGPWVTIPITDGAFGQLGVTLASNSIGWNLYRQFIVPGQPNSQIELVTVCSPSDINPPNNGLYTILDQRPS